MFCRKSNTEQLSQLMGLHYQRYATLAVDHPQTFHFLALCSVLKVQTIPAAIFSAAFDFDWHDVAILKQAGLVNSVTPDSFTLARGVAAEVMSYLKLTTATDLLPKTSAQIPLIHAQVMQELRAGNKDVFPIAERLVEMQQDETKRCELLMQLALAAISNKLLALADVYLEQALESTSDTELQLSVHTLYCELYKLQKKDALLEKHEAICKELTKSLAPQPKSNLTYASYLGVSGAVIGGILLFASNKELRKTVGPALLRKTFTPQ